MKKILLTLALLLGLVALAPSSVRAASPTPNGGGIYPPAPLTVTHSGNTFTISHQGLTPATTWSCTILDNAGKVGSLPVLYGQAYQSCTTGMKYISLRLYYHSCFSDWFGTCFLPGSDTLMGVACTIPNAVSQWCPASGTYNVGVPIGSYQQVTVAAQASDWSGVTATGSALSSVIAF